MTAPFRPVAAFDAVHKADLAQVLLDEAGIPAVVTDRELVSMDWLMGGAIGGVKVQVPEDRLTQAEAILAERFGDDLQPFSEGVSEEELARQALAAPAEDDDPPAEPADK